MNNISPVNATLKYGAYNGIAAFILFAGLWGAGKNPLGSLSVVGWALPILFTALAIREHRNKDLGGYITYGRALGTGMLLSVFAGFLFAVLAYAFMMFIGHNIPQMQIDDFYANMDKVKGIIGADKYETVMQKFEESKSSFTPSGLALSSFESRIIGGFIISLAIAGMYTKKQPPFEVITDTETPPTV